ncbi:16505_t:CDS:1, partial [Entrophospora sp. SA101]
IVYYIAQNHISMKKLPSLVQLAKELHTSDISDKSLSYSNEIAGNDILAALSEVISEKISDELSEVEFFGVIIDESTDITTTKHLNVYITYVSNN